MNPEPAFQLSVCKEIIDYKKLSISCLNPPPPLAVGETMPVTNRF